MVMVSWVYTSLQTLQVVYINYTQLFVCRKKWAPSSYFPIIPAVPGNIWTKFSKLPLHRITGLYIEGTYLTVPETEAKKHRMTSFPSLVPWAENSHHYWNCCWVLFQGLEDFLVSQVFSLVFYSKISNIQEKHQGSRLDISMLGWY